MTTLLLLALGLSHPPAPQVIGPRVSEKPVVTYRFRSRRARSHFRCAVDESPFRPCRSPYRLRLTVGVHTLRVRDGQAGSVAKIRIRILEPKAPEVRVGVAPLDVIAVGDAVWTENYGDGSASIVDGATRQAIRVQVGGVPGGIASGGGSVWIADFGDGSVARLDPSGHLQARIALGGQSSGVAISGGIAYVADYTGGLWRIDTSTNQPLGRTSLPGRAGRRRLRSASAGSG